MTTTNPGAPRTDELARNAALHALIDITDAFREFEDAHPDTADTTADAILHHHTVTWERDTNSAGVPVRRYVLRSEWEVDPAPPAHLEVLADRPLWPTVGGSGVIAANRERLRAALIELVDAARATGMTLP